MAKWVKKSSYGNYRDPVQNHKFDDWLVFNTKTKKLVKVDKLANMINAARWFFGKHIGSKPLDRIRYTRRIPKISKAKLKRFIESIKNNETSIEASN